MKIPSVAALRTISLRFRKMWSRESLRISFSLFLLLRSVVSSLARSVSASMARYFTTRYRSSRAPRVHFSPIAPSKLDLFDMCMRILQVKRNRSAHNHSGLLPEPQSLSVSQIDFIFRRFFSFFS